MWATNHVEWLPPRASWPPPYRRRLRPPVRLSSAGAAYALARLERPAWSPSRLFRCSDYPAMLCELIPEPMDTRQPVSSPFPAATAGGAVRLAKAAATYARRERPDVSGSKFAGTSFSISQDQPSARRLPSTGTTPSLCHDTAAALQDRVVLSHHNLLNNAWFAAQRRTLAAEIDRPVCRCLFTHCFGAVLRPTCSAWR
ncbi:MAG: hypothetical protein R2864_09025 [Syntrophotaleaceae bacterium]